MKHLVSIASCALCIFLSGLRSYAEPVTITVRIIDARNGKPYKKLHLRVMFLRARQTPKGFSSDSEARANLIASELETTNDKGEITLDAPTPLPGVINIDSGPTGCGPGSFDTRAVLEAGVLGANQCRTKLSNLKARFETKPGEIIYFAAPIGFFEGMLTK